MADVADGLDGRLEAIVLVEEAILDHVQDEGGGADLQIGRDLGHVRVAHDHVQAPVALGIGMGLVARIDDRARGRRGPRDLLADVLGALAQAIVKAARRLQHLPGAGEDLARDEEGDEPFGQPLEGHVPADEVVLVAAIGVAGGVRIVLEQQDVAGDAVFPKPLLRLVQQVLDDALARLVVDDEVGDVVALGRGVLGMEARVEIEAGAVLEEDIGVAGARDDLLEQVPRDIVGRQPPLAVQRAGEAVLVLEPEDAPLHLRTRVTEGRSMGKV